MSFYSNLIMLDIIMLNATILGAILLMLSTILLKITSFSIFLNNARMLSVIFHNVTKLIVIPLNENEQSIIALW